MAYCKQCGAQIPDGSAFCPSCGAKNDGNGTDYGQSQQYQYDNQYQYGNQTQQPNDIQDNKAISILCYFGIFLLIPLLTKPDSPFVKYHSNQGLVLLIFSLISWVVTVIPLIGGVLAGICGVFGFVCFIIGIVHVANGEMKELPLIGKIQILK